VVAGVSTYACTTPLYVESAKSGFGARGGVVRPEMVPHCALDRARVPTIHANEGTAKIMGSIDPQGRSQHPKSSRRAGALKGVYLRV
jgi:hypothetical protein